MRVRERVAKRDERTVGSAVLIWDGRETRHACCSPSTAAPALAGKATAAGPACALPVGGAALDAAVPGHASLRLRLYVEHPDLHREEIALSMTSIERVSPRKEKRGAGGLRTACGGCVG